MDGAEGIRTMSRLHARHGTTTLLPTTMTNPWDRIMAALNAVAEVQRTGGVEHGAQIVGAHVEGPFISPGRLGAQPPETLDPTPECVREVLDTGVVRAITIAPELTGALAAAQMLVGAGVRVGVGHTLADAETVSAFVQAVQQWGGQICATHLYNAMGGIEGRIPGPPAALMADPHTFLEVILDNVHVHPTSFRLACAAAPGRMVLVTDAMRAAGLGDGESEFGRATRHGQKWRGTPVGRQPGRQRVDDGRCPEERSEGGAFSGCGQPDDQSDSGPVRWPAGPGAIGSWTAGRLGGVGPRSERQKRLYRRSTSARLNNRKAVFPGLHVLGTPLLTGVDGL